jgi:tetratricopeptide (TPR) repeat protein
VAGIPRTDADAEREARALLSRMVPRLAEPAHQILGIAVTASPDEARQAFLRLTKLYHPAKFARQTPEIVRIANDVFVTIKRAYEQLTGNGRGAGPRSATEPPTRPTGAARTPSAPPPPGPGAPATPPAARAAAGARPASTPPAAAAPARPSTPAIARSASPTAAPMRPHTPSPAPARPATAPTTTAPATRAATAAPSTRAATTAPATRAATTAPATDPALEAAHDLLRRRLWSDARQAFHQLAIAAPSDKRLRAYMHYARGREASEAGRGDEARAELQRALALDPELTAAKRALDDLPPEPPRGGLVSRLLRR